MMADKPILFSAPMIRALLDGRKTQTRRVLKPQPDFRGGAGDYHDAEEWGWEDEDGYHVSVLDICPNGFRVGDRLWVREACATWVGDILDVVYRADETDEEWDNLRHDAKLGFWKLRPSIHMPRWASRLTLIVTDARVQRLQEISGPDCWAEGIEFAGWDCDKYGSVTHCYRDLWNSLHGPGAWDSNPWVCALTFTVNFCNIDQMPGVRDG